MPCSCYGTNEYYAQFVGGATEETIVARVAEGIVSAIGSTDTHTDALEAPNEISKRVLEAGLDASTASIFYPLILQS